MEVQPGKKRPRSPEGRLTNNNSTQTEDNHGKEHDEDARVNVLAQNVAPPPHPLLIPPPQPHRNTNKATNGNDSHKPKEFTVEWQQSKSAGGGGGEGGQGQGHSNGLTTTSSSDVAIAVVTMSSAKTCVSIAGRCSLHVRTGSVEILGYTIYAAGDNDDDEKDHDKNKHAGGSNSEHQVEEYHLESPSWTAWSTVLSLEPDTILVIKSSSSSTSSSTKDDDTVVEGPTEGPVERPEPVVPTFQIHGVQSTETTVSAATSATEVRQVQVQPTLIPTSWKLATDHIVQDLQATDSAEQSKPRHAIFRDTLEEEDELPRDNNGENKAIVQNKNHGFRIVVAGAKGVGKSTCVRYLVNRLLSPTSTGSDTTDTQTSNIDITGGGGGFEAVAVLDADPGQPELSPTGMLTLTILRGPLLQQPYHHMVAGANNSSSSYDDTSDNDGLDHGHETLGTTGISMRHQHGSGCQEHGNRNEQAYFFGSNTSQSDPVRYLECVAALLQSYENLVEKQKSFGESSNSIPLIVNLDGWVKGFGEQILQAMLGQHIRPNHILQIIGDLKSKVFDLSAQVTDPTVLHVAYAYNSMQDQFVGHDDDCDESTAPTTNSLSYYGPSGGGGNGNSGGFGGARVAKRVPVQSFSISAANLRAQRLATYFCGARVWDSVGFGQNGIDDPACKIANHVAAMKPYIVPWEAVDWQNFALPDTSGDIVSPDMILHALNGSVVGLCRRQSDDSTTSENHLLSCVGLGLIRAIDRVRQLFLVITPVAPEQLASVNVLSQGVISVPLEFYFRGVRSECFPYQACDDSKQLDVLGADPMKSRNSIARKGGGN